MAAKKSQTLLTHQQTSNASKTIKNPTRISINLLFEGKRYERGDEKNKGQKGKEPFFFCDTMNR
jgi:hypothetical protein